MNVSPRICARACIIRDGRLLLSKYRDERGYWYVTPGGGQVRGETLEECVVREAREELGIDVISRGQLSTLDMMRFKQTDANGNTMTYGYDDQNRRISTTNAAGKTSTTTFA
jgi:YD repeat-containing protein